MAAMLFFLLYEEERICNILNNNKTIDSLNDKTGIHKLRCEGFNSIHIGQTVELLKQYLITLSRSNNNKHITQIDNNHNIELVYFTHCKKGYKLDTLEKYEIFKGLQKNKYVKSSTKNPIQVSF